MAPSALAQVLSRLPKLAMADVLVGTETSDDAGAVRLPGGGALLATVDFITPLCDDPIMFGRIAAANAVSDVFAMGGKPIAALSIACFPKDRPVEELGDILRGGAETMGAAGVPVIGGHTVEDAEMKIGYAVMGLCAPDRLWRNSTARVGDSVILTKKLGTGILAGAARSDKADARQWAAAQEQMAMLNQAAAGALAKADVHAATDITGFGLLGHAMEMAVGSGVTLRLDAARLPVLDGACELASRGIGTRAKVTNREYVAGKAEVAESVDPSLVDVALDAQTSGGLLVAVGDEGDALARLREAGVEAWVVGRCEPAGPRAVTLS